MQDKKHIAQNRLLEEIAENMESVLDSITRAHDEDIGVLMMVSASTAVIAEMLRSNNRRVGEDSIQLKVQGEGAGGRAGEVEGARRE